ncbi:YwmB family TATA-box binding protein [Fervidibacillus halotolerans]|uniref:YwmB family TATA-box binding protein n=1 Tax=Fervidibacillus halotolerans TaxID=2980027 RepID=A0A9E8M039_9BACI|nr:YwmB family TATA-box binding protein [Fervidibacillus halotolerans]WAA12161.1 YwmB family TATA-box binding protein [Fervidibacillus halotolerans]
MKKKSIFLTVFVFIFIFILFTKDRALVANDSDLNKIMDVIDENEGKVTEWQLIAREPIAISIEQRLGQKEKWERQYPEFTWKEREEKGEWVILGEYIAPDDLYKETIQIVTTRLNSMYEGFILYELKGTKWTEHIRLTTEKKVNHFFPQLFRKTPSLFACMTGVFNDMMDIAAMEKALNINELLQGEIVEKLEEKHFVSLTSRSPYFSNELTANEKTFNVQISVRKNDRGDAVFAIGTPILTIEY